MAKRHYKPEEKRKTKHIGILVTGEEYKIIEEKVKRSGRTLSGFVRYNLIYKED